MHSIDPTALILVAVFLLFVIVVGVFVQGSQAFWTDDDDL